jgi:predicted SnoaL-like aldol condensation-catalyzing enzyme
MIEIVDPKDTRAVRNKENVLALYDAMINNKNPEEAVSKFLEPNYIQHNPLVPDGAAGLAGFFGKMTKDRAYLRVVVHRIIAAGDYVWAHVNFISLYNDNPQHLGIAGVDIYKMNQNGKAIEHWDVLQEVGDPKEATHTNGMF